MSWGGRRPGAGAKPKSVRYREMIGKRPRSASVLTHPSAPSVAPVVDPWSFVAPEDFSAAERQIFDRQAVLALKQGTLTQATRLAFERYCRLAALELACSKGDAEHIRLEQRVNTLELQFLLTPCGKALYEPAGDTVTPENPLERFMRKRG